MSDRRRAALITGSGQNIGRAAALALAADGYDVVINGSANRDACNATAELARASGIDSVVAMGDVGTAQGCDSVVETALDTFGGVDVLVNNAAIRPSDAFLETDDETWQRVIDVNMTAAVRLARACLPGMVERGWGRIINFAGMNAIHGYSGRAHVSVSKHGVWGLSKALGKEFGPHGITVNTISPGPIKSEHDDPAMTAHIEGMKARVPVGRLGEPDEIAAMVALLVSDKGAFINGQLLQVNGGTET